MKPLSAGYDMNDDIYSVKVQESDNRDKLCWAKSGVHVVRMSLIFFGSRGALILLLIDKFSLDTGNDIQFNTKYDNISIYIGSCPAVLHAHITL